MTKTIRVTSEQLKKAGLGSGAETILGGRKLKKMMPTSTFIRYATGTNRNARRS